MEVMNKKLKSQNEQERPGHNICYLSIAGKRPAHMLNSLPATAGSKPLAGIVTDDPPRQRISSQQQKNQR